MNTCCICGKEFDGYGNNPYPVKDDGCCCDECNANVVIPSRIALYVKNQQPNASLKEDK